MSLEPVLDMLLGITPVPGLSIAWNSLKFLVSAVDKARDSNYQLQVLTRCVAYLIQTLDEEFKAKRLTEPRCAKQLRDLQSLLDNITVFVQEERQSRFVRLIFTSDSRNARIAGFYREIEALYNAFNISSLIKIDQDLQSVSNRLQLMEQNLQLSRVLDAPTTSQERSPFLASEPTVRQRIFFYPKCKDAYYAFTNWAPYPVKYNGKTYPTSEHLFQAFKYMDFRPDIAEKIRTVSKSSGAAYDLSMTQLAHQHPDWEILKIPKMEIVLYHKFSQHENLKQLLLGTSDAEIINYTTEEFWGFGEKGKGRNEAGKILERLRKTFRPVH